MIDVGIENHERLFNRETRMRRKIAKKTAAKKKTPTRKVQPLPKPLFKALFKAGDVVRLRSGGPAMTITGTSTGINSGVSSCPRQTATRCWHTTSHPSH